MLSAKAAGSVDYKDFDATPFGWRRLLIQLKAHEQDLDRRLAAVELAYLTGGMSATDLDAQGRQNAAAKSATAFREAIMPWTKPRKLETGEVHNAIADWYRVVAPEVAGG